VTDLASLEVFLRGRLRTSGLVAAGLAAAACTGAQIMKCPKFRGAVFAPEISRGGTVTLQDAGIPQDAGCAGGAGSGGRGESAALVRDHGFWSELDAEADARIPAPAQREASRRQGRALLRAARVVWPDAAGLASLAAAVRSRGARVEARGVASRQEYRGGPHHAAVLGAAAAAAGCEPLEASRIAAYQAVAGPASAAVRLLALDPMRATGVLARLAGDIDQIAAQGAAHADGPLGDLPCASAPALDLLAETHIRAEVRLFES
jgi:urease accessory protein